MYFEHFEFIDDAIAREKQIKKFRRQKKNQLIDDFNPGWNDMLDESF